MIFFYTADGFYKKIEFFEEIIDTSTNIMFEINTQQNNLIILINNINEQKKQLPQSNLEDKLNNILTSLQEIQNEFTVLSNKQANNEELIKQYNIAFNNVNDINNNINNFKNQLEILYQNNNSNNINNINNITQLSGYINNLQEQLKIANHDLEKKKKITSIKQYKNQNKNIINKIKQKKKLIEELKNNCYMTIDNFIKDIDVNIETTNNKIKESEQRIQYNLDTQKKKIQITQDNIQKSINNIQINEQYQSTLSIEIQNIQQKLNEIT
jgi:DNA repair exonuclease SbcCD ATPase subunit